MTKKYLLIALCFAALAVSCNKEEEGGGGGGGEEKKPFTPVVGEAMPAWQEGCFDIHFINTPGCGECTYLIYPDGTQMLIDAAGTIQATGAISSSVANTEIRQRWEPEGIKGLTKDNITFNCGKWIADYIKHCQEWTGRSGIDYVMATHFHTDHIGAINSKTGTSFKSYARLTSMVYILENFKVSKVVDRDYPNYNYPLASAMTGNPVTNWKKAVTYQANQGTSVQKFDVGSTSQFSPAVDAGKCPGFTALSLSANGDIWTGSEVKKTFPTTITTENCPEENHCSATMKFTYGAFDYYASADMQYDGCSSNPWLNISTNVAQYCGEVDVMKAEHHGCSNTNGTGLYSPYIAKSIALLKPKCWIVCGWDDGHPRQTTFERLQELRGNQTDIYIANSCASMRKYANYAGRVKADDGHVVVRVYDNGSKYYVFTVEEFDSNDSKQLTPTYKVKSVNTYNSK